MYIRTRDIYKNSMQNDSNVHKITRSRADKAALHPQRNGKKEYTMMACDITNPMGAMVPTTRILIALD